MKEICTEFRECLSSETNTLISISSGDRHAKELASGINAQLRLLRKQRRQYLAGDMELKEAITNISHDLRTPLTAICGYLDLLKQERKSEEIERYIDIIKNRAEVLMQLTEEFFRYSVIITTESDDAEEPVIINDVLEESIVAFYAVLNERKITPNIQITEDKVIRTLDRSALSRVFSNLMNNAIRYSDGDLGITLLKTGEILFSNTASELNEVQVGKLFDRFYTVEAARKSTGLGLAIAKTLIIKMNGTISAKYEKQQAVHLYFICKCKI
jgi:signal transduction histidine kinase